MQEADDSLDAENVGNHKADVHEEMALDVKEPSAVTKPVLSSEKRDGGVKKSDYNVLVNTTEQLYTLLDLRFPADKLNRIYVDSDLFFLLDRELREKLMEYKKTDSGISFFVALPFVTRKEDLMLQEIFWK